VLGDIPGQIRSRTGSFCQRPNWSLRLPADPSQNRAHS
jgi:hypothetical protein